MDAPPPSTDRRKTSFTLSPAAMKNLARAKFELLSRFDMQASQGEIIEVLLLHYARDIDALRQLLQQRQGVLPQQ